MEKRSNMKINEGKLGKTEESYIYADGFDDAMIGHGLSFGGECVVYDHEKVIEILMKDMTREEAEEYFSFNIIGAYVGKNMPVFVKRTERFN
jgi:hypothetical protein